MSTKHFLIISLLPWQGPVGLSRSGNPQIQTDLAVILLIISVMILPIAAKIGQLKIAPALINLFPVYGPVDD